MKTYTLDQIRVAFQKSVYAEFKTDIHTSHTDARFLPENTLLVGFRLPL